MANTKVLVICAAVIAALTATPLIVSHQMNKMVEETALSLEKHGLKQTVLNKEGYLATHQRFVLDVTDAKKVRDLILSQVIEKNAQYEPFIQSIKEETDKDVALLNGLGLKGEMTYSNIFPRFADLSLCFHQLPPALKEYAIAAPFLEKGILCLDMRVGSDQTIHEVKLRDINGRIKLGGQVLDVDDKAGEVVMNMGLSGHALSLNHQGDTLQGLFKIAEQNISSQGDATALKFQSQLNNLAYRFDYKDEFNNKGDFSLSSYSLLLTDEENDINMTLGKIAANSSIETRQKELSAKANYRFDNLSLMDGINDVSVDQLGLSLFLRGIEPATIKKLQTDYNALVLGTEMIEDQVLIDDLLALINHGLKLDVGFKVQGLKSDMLQVKETGIDMAFEIAPNTFSHQQSPLSLLGLLDVTSKVKVHKDDRTTLENLGVTSAEEFALGRAEGDFLIYEIAMKKGAISVNGKAIE